MSSRDPFGADSYPATTSALQLTNSHLVQTVAIPILMEAARISLIENKIFSKIQPSTNDRKQVAKCKRLLRTNKAYKIYTVVWKHTVKNKENLSFFKDFDEESKYLTQYSLAVKLAEGAGGARDVSRINTEVRDVCIAASTYQLIERIEMNGNRIHLKGTSLLNDFMSELAILHLEILASLPPQIRFSELDRDGLP